MTRRKGRSDRPSRIVRAALAVALGAIALGSGRAEAESLTGLTTTNVLVTFDVATPGQIITSVGVTGLQAGETLLGIDGRPANGHLYGLGSGGRLYSIDTTTGAATPVGSAGAFTLSGTAFGFDFNPTVDRIRVISNSGQNQRLNPNDGTLTATDTVLAYAAGDPNAAATPRAVGSAYTNNFKGAVTTTLYDIDSNLDILVTQNPPNGGTLNTVGALGFDTSDLIGFDISGITGIAYAALTAPTGNASQLFTIDLTTGAASLVGTIGGGVPLTGLAAGFAGPASVPEPAALVLLATGLLGLLALSAVGVRGPHNAPLHRGRGDRSDRR